MFDESLTASDHVKHNLYASEGSSSSVTIAVSLKFDHETAYTERNPHRAQTRTRVTDVPCKLLKKPRLSPSHHDTQGHRGGGELQLPRFNTHVHLRLTKQVWMQECSEDSNQRLGGVRRRDKSDGAIKRGGFTQKANTSVIFGLWRRGASRKTQRTSENERDLDREAPEHHRRSCVIMSIWGRCSDQLGSWVCKEEPNTFFKLTLVFSV